MKLEKTEEAAVPGRKEAEAGIHVTVGRNGGTYRRVGAACSFGRFSPLSGMNWVRRCREPVSKRRDCHHHSSRDVFKAKSRIQMLLF